MVESAASVDEVRVVVEPPKNIEQAYDSILSQGPSNGFGKY
jgi:hypothetical protein